MALNNDFVRENKNNNKGFNTNNYDAYETLIKYLTNPKQRQALIEVANNPLSLKSEYHSSDMRCIFITSDEGVYDSLVNAATNENSLKNRYHSLCMNQMCISSSKKAESISSKLCFPCEDEESCKKDLLLIFASKTDCIASCLSMVSTDYFSLSSEYHYTDMLKIFKAKSDKAAKYLSFVATNALSLNSKYHNLDMDALLNAKNDLAASILFHMIIDEELQSSLHHEKEINYILNAESKTKIKALCELIFDPCSRKSPLYLSNLDIIANSNDEKFIDIAVRYIQDENKEFEDKYKKIHNQLANFVTEEFNGDVYPPTIKSKSL